MMGGGNMLIRTVARAAASTGTNSLTPGAASAACSASITQRSPPTNLRTSATSSTTVVPSSASQQSSHVNATCLLTDLDDWDFADHEYIANSLDIPPDPSDSTSPDPLLFASTPPPENHPHLHLVPNYQASHVFGLPPSPSEAHEAASELQIALNLQSPGLSSESTASENSSPSTFTIQDVRPFPHAEINHKLDSRNEPYSGSMEWVEPQLFLSESGTVQVRSSQVYEAFQLLQNDTNVKGAVISIVSDPDVWEAMMKNEKVKELKRIFQNSQGVERKESEPSSAKDLSDLNHDWVNTVSDILHSMFAESKQLVLSVKENIQRIISSIFALTNNKGCAGGDDDPLEKKLKSCMMLAVIVLALVLVKRVNA